VSEDKRRKCLDEVNEKDEASAFIFVL